MGHEEITHPDHYNWHPSGIECNNLTSQCSFNICNILKYCYRYKSKGTPVKDLQKALQYLEFCSTRSMDYNYITPEGFELLDQFDAGNLIDKVCEILDDNKYDLPAGFTTIHYVISMYLLDLESRDAVVDHPMYSALIT